MTGMGEWIVVLGAQRYRVRPSWARLPGGLSLDAVSQVAVDSRGRVYALQRTDPPVTVFEPDGSFVMSIGDGLVLDSHGIAVDPQDRIWVVDRDAHQLLVFSTEGQLLSRLGVRGRPRLGRPFNHPTDVAFAADGETYVSDGYGNARIHRFSADGRHLDSWGEPGRGPGQFSTPHAIWVDAKDRVLVADRESDRVQVFDRTGHLLAIWEDVYRPMDIFETAWGIVVSDQVPRLSLFDHDGQLVGRCRPVLNGAHGVWGGPDGSLFCAEIIPSRITRLEPILAEDEV